MLDFILLELLLEFPLSFAFCMFDYRSCLAFNFYFSVHLNQLQLGSI